MGSLVSAVQTADGASLLARNSLAIILAMPLLSVIVVEVYPTFASMAPAQAVVIFGVIGGTSGLISQMIAGGMLDKLGRSVNVLEMVPSVFASILASAIATWVLLPPNPNPVTSYLRAAGSLPQ